MTLNVKELSDVTMLSLTVMNDNDIASKFNATIRIGLNNGFNYSHSAE